MAISNKLLTNESNVMQYNSTEAVAFIDSDVFEFWLHYSGFRAIFVAIENSYGRPSKT